MKNKNKTKGQSLTIVTILVVTMIAIITFWIIQTGEKINDAERMNLCIKSIQTNSKLRFDQYSFADNVICPTKQVNIESKDKEEIFKKISDEQIECKDIYIGNKGRELFSGEGTFCAVCSVIDFKSKEKLLGYGKYITKKKMLRQDMTIFEYLQSKKSETSISDLDIKSGEIDTSKDYAMIFVHSRGRDSINNLLERSSTQSGKVIIGSGITATGTGLAMFLLGSNPIGWTIIGATGIVAGTSAVYNYFFESGSGIEWMSQVFFMEYSKETFDTLGCESLPAEQSNY